MRLNGWLVNVHCSLPVCLSSQNTHTHTHTHTPLTSLQVSTPADKVANCVANVTVLNLRTITQESHHARIKLCITRLNIIT